MAASNLQRPGRQKERKPSAVAAQLRRRAQARLPKRQKIRRAKTPGRKSAADTRRKNAKQLRFETLIADLSTKFIRIPASKIDREINEALQAVCECLGLDVGVLWQWDLGMPETFVLTHIYRPLGGPPVPERMDASVHFPWSLRQMQQGKMYAVRSTEHIPAEAAIDQASWRHYGIKSVATFPLSVGGGPPFGVLSFNSMRVEQTWPEPLMKQLESVVQTFSSALVRKRDEQALQASEARLSLAADSAGVGLWSLDLASKRFWVTGKMRELFPFAEAEVVTWDRFVALAHPEDRELLQRELQEVVQSGRECRVEYRSLGSDGSVRWMVSRGRLHRGSPEAPGCVMGVTMDITKRKRVEETLRASEERLDLAFRGAQDGIWDWNLETDDVFYSSRWKTMLGYDESEIEPHISAWKRLLHPDDLPRAMRAVEDVLHGKRDFVMEFRMRHKDGHYVDILSRGFPVRRGPKGPVVRIVGTHFDLTERKRAQEALERVRWLHAETEKLGKVGGWEFDIDTGKQTWTEETYHIHEVDLSHQPTVEEGINFFAPASKPIIQRVVQRAIEHGEPYDVELEIVTAKGNLRKVHAVGKPDLEHRRVYGFIQDITERKQAEQAVAETELRYRLLFEAIPESVLVIGTDGRVVAANPASARLYGYESAKQLEGFYTPLLIAEKDRARATQIQSTVVQGKEQPSRHYTEVRRDGSEFIAEVSSAIIRGSGQEVLGYLGITRDITAFVEADAALRRSVERFRQVAEIAGEFIWEVDATGLYTYASPSVERILGYTPEELVGKKHFYDLFDPLVRERLKIEALQVFAARQTFRDFPNANVSKSGKIVQLETSGIPMLDSAGNLVGYRGADTDVTERRNVEMEAQRSRAEIAHLSRVNMLGELAGSLAHELNQPLTAVLSNAQAAQRFLARDSPDLNEVRDILADIVAEDKRAGEIIRRLRLLLKKGEVQHQPLNGNKVVQEVLKLVHSDLVNQNFTAQTELAPDLPVLHGDRVQLQQVLLNLVMNACDAMSGGERDQRRLTLRTCLAEDGSVRFSVTDCGAGIAPDKLEKVFEPFYTTKPHGMGLGLAVCRTIVTAHGGKLWATNNPGRGATFHVSLPAAKIKPA